MEDNEEILSRIKTAIDFVRDGRPFTVGDLFFKLDSDVLTVCGVFNSNIESNVTKERSLRELDAIEHLFMRMKNASTDLDEFIKDKTIKYKLVFNYGMGSIIVCSKTNNIVKWENWAFKN